MSGLCPSPPGVAPWMAAAAPARVCFSCCCCCSVAQPCLTLCDPMDCNGKDFVTPWTAACQASLSFTISWSLLKLMSVELVMPSNHLILCHPLFLLSTIFPSMKVFSNELVLCIMWLKYWSFSFSISPSNEYSELISFRMDWFDLLSVQRNLKSFLQHHSSKTSILQCSAFFYCPALTSVHEYWKNYWKMLRYI